MAGAHSIKKERSVSKTVVVVLCILAVLGVAGYFLSTGLSMDSDDADHSESIEMYGGTVTLPEGAPDSNDDGVASAFGLQTREIYTNNHYGFSVNVPVSFMLGSEINDGNGIMLVSSSLRMTVLAVGYDNNEGFDATSLANELWNHTSDSIVRTDGNRVVIYQYDKEYEYFIWAYVGADAINQMTIRYPLQDENQEELEAAQTLMQGFRPGELDASQ